MAVYEQTYKPYGGGLTPQWSRLLVIPRHALRGVFKSKIFAGLFTASFVPPLVFAIIIYLHHNVTALAMFEITSLDIIPINASFFHALLFAQSIAAFLITVKVGPNLVSDDIQNNALPLYLCRPISRTEYVLGKALVLMALLSAVTWVPGLLLVVLQASLDGYGWIARYPRIPIALFVGSWLWIGVLTLLSLALSATFRRSLAARGAFVGLYFISSAVANAVNAYFDTKFGSVLSLGAPVNALWHGLFNSHRASDLPIPAATISVVCLTLFCLYLISRKVRAYEVVS